MWGGGLFLRKTHLKLPKLIGYTAILKYITLIILIPFAIFPFVLNTNYDASARNPLLIGYGEIIKKFDVDYHPWIMLENVERNGLFLHLLQSSVSTLPERASNENHLKFKELIRPPSEAKRPANIIFILCEACWYDNNNFYELFQPLREQSFQELRAISPAYGGGTANAEFEILTGLSSRSHFLSGIIYQEYHKSIKEDAETIAKSFKRLNYKTFAAHNYDRHFWRRDELYPKLGLNEFVALDGMNYIWNAKFPDDKALFDTALKKLQQENGHLFMHLITVSTHGGYDKDSDFGEKDYQKRLALSISRIKDFVEQVDKYSPDSLILIYGDHKPALNRYFAEKNVFTSNDFKRSGEKDEDFIFSESVSTSRIGDVPVLLRTSDKSQLNKFVPEATGMPFFCLVQKLDFFFLQTGHPIFNYTNSNTCLNSLSYQKKVDSMPEWLYSEALF